MHTHGALHSEIDLAGVAGGCFVHPLGCAPKVLSPGDSVKLAKCSSAPMRVGLPQEKMQN